MISKFELYWLCRNHCQRHENGFGDELAAISPFTPIQDLRYQFVILDNVILNWFQSYV